MPTRCPYARDINPIICPAYYPPSLLRTAHKRRNINLLSIGLPCPKAQLSLGTANPPMIDIAEETLGLRRSGLSPDLRLLIPTFSPPSAPPRLTSWASLQLEVLPYRMWRLRSSLVAQRVACNAQRQTTSWYKFSVFGREWAAGFEPATSDYAMSFGRT